MMKTAILASAVLFGAAAPTASYEAAPSATAEQTMMNLPETDAVIAQFSYLELCHDETGFNFAVTDKSAVFVDVEFPGDFHIRIGF
jgi:hypothetical protein